MGWIYGQNTHGRFIGPRAFPIPNFKKKRKEKCYG
jgi:hypothetical protein